MALYSLSEDSFFDHTIMVNSYSLDDKIYYDFKNVDDRIEDILDF